MALLVHELRNEHFLARLQCRFSYLQPGEMVFGVGLDATWLTRAVVWVHDLGACW